MSISSIDLILPCYNPASNWSENIVDNFESLSSKINYKMNLILVNDGSTIGVSKKDIQLLTDRIPDFKYIYYDINKGKGHALREGLKKGNSKVTIYTDIDFPYTEESIIALIDLLIIDNSDIVLGIRDENYYSNVPPLRTFISKILKSLIKTFLNIPTTDTQCGLKGFKEKGKALFLKTEVNRYLFDLEFIYLAGNSNKVNIKLCKVKLKPGIVFSRMNWKVLFQESINFMKILIKQ